MELSLYYQKNVDADMIQQFRSICLLNCLCKWIAKTLLLWLDPLVDKLILKIQKTFMKNRNTMIGVMALHEVLHDLSFGTLTTR